MSFLQRIGEIFAAAFSNVGSHLQGAWQLVTEGGRKVWRYVEPPLRFAAAFPLAVASLFSPSPTPDAVDQISHDRELKAEATHMAREEVERQLPDFATCARMIAATFDNPRQPIPEIRHLTARQRAWLTTMDRELALAVRKVKHEDLNAFGAGKIRIRGLRPLPGEEETKEVVAALVEDEFNVAYAGAGVRR